MKLLGFSVERVGLGVCNNDLIKGWSQREDAFDFKASKMVRGRLYTVFIEVTGCSLTLSQSRIRLWRLARLNRPAVLVQKSKIDKYERLKPEYPVVLVHTWDRLLKIDWVWMSLVKNHVLGELRLNGEPNPYLVVSLDVWKPLTRLPNEIAHPPLTSLADLIPRKRRGGV
ncbi:hypothetical protein DRO58_04010 [Candidatus Bathyarchaeota archaeon]|nr:MAG: hypothetical protein DRO58_04010 [Candidatus Bathyarchaeota archaeon]